MRCQAGQWQGSWRVMCTFGVRPSVIVTSCDCFFFLAFIWPPKAKGCNSSTYGQINIIFKKLHVSFSYTCRVPGIRDTYTIYVSFSYKVSGHKTIVSNICGTIRCGNKMMACCPGHYLRGQIVATPFFVAFSHLGNVVEQHWSPYGV